MHYSQEERDGECQKRPTRSQETWLQRDKNDPCQWCCHRLELICTPFLLELGQNWRTITTTAEMLYSSCLLSSFQRIFPRSASFIEQHLLQRGYPP